MKNLLFLALVLSWLSSCSQSQNIAGEYEKLSENGSIEFLLKLNPDGTFHFDSYSVRQIDGNALSLNVKKNLPAGPGLSGKGSWSVEKAVIYFRTNPTTDKNYKNTLDFNETKAKYVINSSEDISNEIQIEKLEFFDAGIFWIEGLELIKRK